MWTGQWGILGFSISKNAALIVVLVRRSKSKQFLSCLICAGVRDPTCGCWGSYAMCPENIFLLGPNAATKRKPVVLTRAFMTLTLTDVLLKPKRWQTCERRSHRKHSRTVLEGVGQAWHASVVWEARVAVARRQRRVEEGLLCGVMCLGLVLLRLG